LGCRVGRAGVCTRSQRINPHKLYAGAIAAVVALALLVGGAWSSHVRDEAKRDAVIDAQKSDIAKLEQSIKDSAAAAREQIAALEKQKQTVIQQPQQAPTIIREQIPFSQPVLQTAPITKETLPDAPVAQLTRLQEQELAQYALTCKQCSLDRDRLAGALKAKDEINARQKVELDAALKAARGGSIWQRTKKYAKWFGVGVLTGAVLVKAAH
jgi:hypothetical protein